MLLMVTLMILFSAPESFRGCDIRRNPTAETPGLLQVIDCGLRQILLLFIVIEDNTAILRAEIRPLPVHLRRVVNLEENAQQHLIRNLLGIVSHFHGLGVTGGIGAHFAISWFILVAA